MTEQSHSYAPHPPSCSLSVSCVCGIRFRLVQKVASEPVSRLQEGLLRIGERAVAIRLGGVISPGVLRNTEARKGDLIAQIGGGEGALVLLIHGQIFCEFHPPRRDGPPPFSAMNSMPKLIACGSLPADAHGCWRRGRVAPPSSIQRVCSEQNNRV